MLKAFTEINSKVSVIPSDCPKFWEIVSCFATQKEDTNTQASLTPEKAKTFIQNLELLEPTAFTSHQQLAIELQSFAEPLLTKPLGVLISSKSECKVCNSGLLVKADRPSKVVLYNDQFGTTQRNHYSRKICKRFRAGCSFVQHYGYHTNGGENIVYDDDFMSLPYFINKRNGLRNIPFATV